MRRSRPHQILIFIGLMALGAAWIAATAIWFQPPAKTNAAPQVGFPAPDFELTTAAGDTIRLRDYRTRVVLINVWASWCPPCQAEMPDLQQIYQERQSQGFIILAVNATAGDSAAAAQAFFADAELTFPMLLDPESQVSAAYQVQLLPTSFLIDQDGIVRGRYTGAINAALLNSELDALLPGDE